MFLDGCRKQEVWEQSLLPATGNARSLNLIHKSQNLCSVYIYVNWFKLNYIVPVPMVKDCRTKLMG